jgi:hypothetical protein
MNAGQSLTDPRLMAELTMHLRKTGSKLSPAEAAAVAIRTWINAQQGPAAPATESGATRGYQWKSLFLPEGTELRRSTAGSVYHARVVGDDIVFNGRKVSPRGMTLAIAGEGRNAWRDIGIKFPGERCFVPASRCRREQAHEPSPPAAAPAASPADSLNAAVLTMSEALTTMLALMQQAGAPKKPVDERRTMASRREVDVMADCAF